MTVNGAVGDLRWGRGQFIVPCQDLTLVLEQVTVQPSVSEQPECLCGWEEGPRDEERGSLEGFVSQPWLLSPDSPRILTERQIMAHALLTSTFPGSTSIHIYHGACESSFCEPWEGGLPL